MYALPPPPPAIIRKAMPRASSVAVGAAAPAGSSLSVAWSGLAAADGQNWVGLYAPGTPFRAYLDWVWLLPTDNGTVNLPVAPARAAGQYELRVYHGSNPTLLAQSGPVLVTSSQPGPVPIPPPPLPITQYGPRGPTGPDVPLSAAEQSAFAARVTVAGRTAAAIQAACAQAAAQGVPTVYLPPGTYSLETSVNVPAGLTILGAGSQTLCTAPAWNTEMFVAGGNGVRLTRLRLQGWSLLWTDANSGGTYNDSRGVEAFGKEQVRVDHCELFGLCYGVLAELGGSVQVDHCSIHDDKVNGLGYGVCVDSGVWALVTDNEFGVCRTVLSSDDETPGYRQSRWEFNNNHVHNDVPNALYQRDALDTHPTYRGTFVIEGNQFDFQMAHAAGLISGSGLIDGNRFTDETGAGYTAVRLYYAQRNGVGGTLHDVTVTGNVSGNGVTPFVMQASNAVNISVDGTVLPATYQANRPAPPPLLRLAPFLSPGAPALPRSAAVLSVGDEVTIGGQLYRVTAQLSPESAVPVPVPIPTPVPTPVPPPVPTPTPTPTPTPGPLAVLGYSVNPAVAGIPFTVFGKGFAADAAAVLGTGLPLSVSFIDASDLKVFAPLVAAPLSTVVIVTSGGVSATGPPLTINKMPVMPTVTGYRDGSRNPLVMNAAGQFTAIGGTSLYVEGKDFGTTRGTVVANGGSMAIEEWTDTEIEFVLPPYVAPPSNVVPPLPPPAAVFTITRADGGSYPTQGFVILALPLPVRGQR